MLERPLTTKVRYSFSDVFFQGNPDLVLRLRVLCLSILVAQDASEMANVKKSPSNSKRMRTAEMHNQSERVRVYTLCTFYLLGLKGFCLEGLVCVCMFQKRRVKINDKLRALQELIPNGNKVRHLTTWKMSVCNLCTFGHSQYGNHMVYALLCSQTKLLCLMQLLSMSNCFNHSCRFVSRSTEKKYSAVFHDGLLNTHSLPSKTVLFLACIYEQVMSMRTGIGIPSWMIPNVNLQHLQMPTLPQMRLGTDGVGVGMGMRMGMGMGMMDVNAAAVRAGCTVIPMPMYPGQPPTGHSSALQPTDHSQACGIVNAHNFYGSSQVQVWVNCFTNACGFCVSILMPLPMSIVASSNEPEYEPNYPYV